GVRVWSAADGKQKKSWSLPMHPFGKPSLSADGKSLLFVSSTWLFLFDLEKGQVKKRINAPPGFAFRSARFAGKGHALTGGGDYKRGQDGRFVKENDKLVPVNCVVQLWDLETGKELCRCAGHEDLVAEVAGSDDLKRAVSLGLDRTLRVWDLTGKKR